MTSDSTVTALRQAASGWRRKNQLMRPRPTGRRAFLTGLFSIFQWPFSV
jgi:hypothetical protein